MASKLPDQYIESVLEATSIVDLINKTVELKKSGPEFVGLCPFHNESTPSFSVNGSKGLFLCRSCGASGNALTYLTESTGMGFIDALETLAKSAGLPSPDEVRGRRPEENGRHQQLYEILDRAEKIYQQALTKNKEAQEYLSSRGITPEMVQSFGIGYAPPTKGFVEKSLKDVPRNLLVESGIAGKSTYKENEIYEYMENRIIFPIKNSSGKTIGFGGRTLNPDDKAKKYLNTPETAIFKKGSEVYGLPQASKTINASKTVIVTEGYLDVVIPSGHGVKNIVSAMGTALQPGAISKLFKQADTIVYCFDGDKAGERAAQRAMKMTASLINERKKCRFVFLPDGMDPDDEVKAHGAQHFMDMIRTSEPMSKYIMRTLMANHNMDEIEGKAGFAADAMDLVNEMTSPTIKGLMVQLIKSTIGEGVPLPDQKQSQKSEASESYAYSTAPQNSPVNAPMPAKSIFTRRRNHQANQASTPPSEENKAPSMAIKILGVFLEDPKTCAYFEASWLDCVTGIPEKELSAIRSVIDFASGQENDESLKQKIQSHFMNTDTGDCLEKAQQDLDRQAIKTNPQARLEGFMNVLMDMNQKNQNMSKLSFKPR